MGLETELGSSGRSASALEFLSMATFLHILELLSISASHIKQSVCWMRRNLGKGSVTRVYSGTLLCL